MKKRAIIFAPHQDDEILACAGTIDQLNKSGIDVFIVFATNGDFCGKEISAIRLQESTTALNALKISSEKIIVLGFADTGMAYEDSFLWNLYHSQPDIVIKSQVADHTYHPWGEKEYSMQKFGFHAPYTRNAFIHLLRHLIEDIKPDMIVSSSLMDAHGDHAALCMFIEEVILSTGVAIPIYQYIIHSGDDKKWPVRETEFFNKPENITEQWWNERISITVDKKLNKRNLIQLFKSQLSPSGYLFSFAKNEEFFLMSKRLSGNEENFSSFVEKV